MGVRVSRDPAAFLGPVAGYRPCMRIRRPVASVLASLALVAGVGGLTGCGASAEPITGGPGDHAQLTTGNSPGSVQQGNLPDLSNRHPSSAETGGANG